MTTTDPPPVRTRRIRAVPLVFGFVFVVVGYGGIIAAADADDAGIWLWPAALAALGTAGLFATIRTALDRRNARREASSDVPPAPGTVPEPDGDPLPEPR